VGVSGFGTPAGSFGGAHHENGFGLFNLTIDLAGGYTTSATALSFVIMNGGTPWAANDAEHILIGNSLGNIGAAHIFVAGNPPVSTSGAVLTGYTASSGGGGMPNEAPEPSVLANVGLGLLVLVLTRRRAVA